MADSFFSNVFVGSETGLLKGIYVKGRKWKNVNNISNCNGNSEITCLCWASSDKTELHAGLRNNCVLTFDACGFREARVVRSYSVEGHIKEIVKSNETFVTGFSEGSVCIWRSSNIVDRSVNESECVISTGDNLWTLGQSPEPRIIATGGKEVSAKVWDITMHEKPIFVAKNVKNDWLNLRVPIWITKIKFLNNHQVVTATGYGQVRLYDVNICQRRPVIDFNFKSCPITALCVCPNSTNKIIVGNTLGEMGEIDIRQHKKVRLFKGFAGCITDIECHPTSSLVVSCSTDRRVRIHSLENHALLESFYLKSRLTRVLLRDNWIFDEEECCTLTNGVSILNGQKNTDKMKTDDDGMWDNFDVVGNAECIKDCS